MLLGLGNELFVTARLKGGWAVGKGHKKAISRQILSIASVWMRPTVCDFLPLPPLGRKQSVAPRKARAFNLSVKDFESKGRWLSLPQRAGKDGSREARAWLHVGIMEQGLLAGRKRLAEGLLDPPHPVSVTPTQLMSPRMPLVWVSRAWDLFKIDRKPGTSCHRLSYCLYELRWFRGHILTLPLHA